MGATIIIALLVLIILLLVNSSNKNKPITYKGDDQYPKDKGHIQLDLEFEQSNSNFGKYLIIDCETTGLPRSRNATYYDLFNWPRIIQLSWLILDDSGKALKCKSFYINPGIPIPSEATRINRITDQMVQEKGVHPVVALRTLRNDLNLVPTVVCHNVEFDIPIIESEFVRFGFNPQIIQKETICTMRSSTNIIRLPGYGRNFKYPKLIELVGFLFYGTTDITIEEAHDAEVDVMLTAKCLLKLQKDYNIQIKKGNKNYQPFLGNVLTPEEVIIPQKLSFPRATKEMMEDKQLYQEYDDARKTYNSLYKKLYTTDGLNKVFGINRVKLENDFEKILTQTFKYFP